MKQQQSTPQSEAKTHLLPQEMLDLLFQQRTIQSVATASLAASFVGGAAAVTVPAGTFPNFAGEYLHARYGFTLDLWLGSDGSDKGHSSAAKVTGSIFLFASKATTPTTGTAGGTGRGGDGDGAGGSGAAEVTLSMASNGTVTLVLKDGTGRNDVQWETDPTCSARLKDAGAPRHLGVVVDAGPRIILFTVDGHLCDGGAHVSGYTPSPSSKVPNGAPAGWSLFSTQLGAVGGSTATVGTKVTKGRLYSRALYTTELVGNWRAGLHA